MEHVYRCLIVDDEKPAHDVLMAHLRQTEGLQFVASAFNGKEALHMLQHEEIDIVFLDIEMPLVNGMELLQALSPKPAVIITTAFQEFAFDAWQNDAVDYLKKPISYVKFMKAVNKAKIYCSQTEKPKMRHTLQFRVDGEMREISNENIIYLSSYGNYVKVFDVTARQPIVVYDTLANVRNNLSKNDFLQIHRSYVVNKAFIASAEKDFVLLQNGERLPVGRKFQILLEPK